MTEIWLALGAIIFAVAGFFGYGAIQRKGGEDDARRDFEAEDQAEADAIRDRIERDRDDRVRDFKDAGWRD